MIRSHARQRTTPWTAGIGPSSTIRARKALCVASSLGGTPGEGMLMRPSGPPLVESDHPVPQRLAVHPSDLRRVFPRGPLERRRDRQEPPRLCGIFRRVASRQTSPAVRAIDPNSSDSDVAKAFLERSDMRFRLKYLFGDWPAEEVDDDPYETETEHETEESDTSTVVSSAEAEAL